MSERWTSVSFSDSGVIPEDLESAGAAPREKDLGGMVDSTSQGLQWTNTSFSVLSWQRVSITHLTKSEAVFVLLGVRTGCMSMNKDGNSCYHGACMLVCGRSRQYINK